MGGADQLHPSLGDRAGRSSFQLAADFVDHDHLWIVILNRLDHHLVLQNRLRHLHPAGAPDGWVWDVAVATDLVRGVHNDNPLPLSQHPGCFPQHGCLADPWRAQQKDVGSGLDDVLDDLDGAVDGSPDTACEAYHVSLSVSDGRDPVEGAGDASPIVSVKVTNASDHALDVVPCHLGFGKNHFAVGVSCGRHAAEVQDDFQ